MGCSPRVRSISSFIAGDSDQDFKMEHLRGVLRAFALKDPVDRGKVVLGIRRVLDKLIPSSLRNLVAHNPLRLPG